MIIDADLENRPQFFPLWVPNESCSFRPTLGFYDLTALQADPFIADTLVDLIQLFFTYTCTMLPTLPTLPVAVVILEASLPGGLDERTRSLRDPITSQNSRLQTGLCYTMGLVLRVLYKIQLHTYLTLVLSIVNRAGSCKLRI